MAELVVQAPRLGLGQHLVGLDRLLEALLGLRRVRHVGVELARQTAECALDLALVCGAREPQNVVVALGRRHVRRVAAPEAVPERCFGGVLVVGVDVAHEAR